MCHGVKTQKGSNRSGSWAVALAGMPDSLPRETFEIQMDRAQTAKPLWAGDEYMGLNLSDTGWWPKVPPRLNCGVSGSYSSRLCDTKLWVARHE